MTASMVHDVCEAAEIIAIMAFWLVLVHGWPRRRR